ncbi:MAG: serine hydroxymethyltransferase, partial [Methanomassiliicoccus sp.]
HTLVLDVEEFQGGAKVAKALEQANIIANKNLLPWDSNPVRPSGIRLGSQEVTRIGMKEGDMDVVAELIHQVVAKGADPDVIRNEVIEFKKGFTKVHYCYFEGEEAYDYPSHDGDL